ncbi:MAG: hypothetical protein IPP82_07155 [Xanthomonadales bacterium]|nr:hypothetical protein [Xanthomonadales bacterium]
MKNQYHRSFLMLSAWILAMVSTDASAALFCVNTVATLQSALTTSGTNGQDDQINIVAGTYSLGAAGLQFGSSEANSLTIFGGYTAGCAQLTSAATKLDGQSLQRPLRIIQNSTSNSASVHVERLTFISGHASSETGGGLEVVTTNAEVRIESSRFLANHAEIASGALFVNTNGLIRLRNNLFFLNDATNIGALQLLTGNSVAYITGNTFVSNSTATTNGVGAVNVGSTTGTHFWFCNNILWNNNANGGADLYASAAVVLRNNDIGVLAGVAPDPMSQLNQNVDPQFASCSGFLCFSFELQRASALVDAGDDAPPDGTGSFDLAGKLRRIGAHVDIGAYEQDVLFRDGFD